MSRIGRYEILEEIGRGGFGRVYRANDPSMKCEVAIKVMANADDPEMVARFRNEATAARKLRHESIVTIYDVGEERGVPYIVMEYLRGFDLQKIREQHKPLTLVEQVRILAQVAAGLQVAHENGIIHPDVKPANNMVLEGGSVKIMDFGIARATRDANTHLTRTGVVVGTLQYIPPEQFEGQPADALADIWAYGVIAYQLFAGRSPFDAPETMQLIRSITTTAIPDVAELNPELPPDLAKIVSKLLQRDRSARYQTFEDIRYDLNPVLELLESQEADRLVDGARVTAARGDLNAAHQLIRQVLDRYPSNKAAKQIRFDHILTQIRADQASRQVEGFIQKGDAGFYAGKFEEALGAYGQACKLNPNSATARMKLDRAQKMVERGRRIRDFLNDARAKLSMSMPLEAEQILVDALAEDPENSETQSLLQRARQERAHQAESARAVAILQARSLQAEQKFSQAMMVLDDCATRLGDHDTLQQARGEIRRAEASAFTLASIEAAISSANEALRKSDYASALAALKPLAEEFPTNADIRELLNFIVSEEARTRRVADQRAAVAAETGPPASSTAPLLAVKPDRAAVIQRALEMSRDFVQKGQTKDAIHVLEVALARYPDASELEIERLKLQPSKSPVDWNPGAAPVIPSLPGAGPLPLPPSRSMPVWLAVAAATVVSAAGLWHFSRPDASPRPDRVGPAPALTAAPAATTETPSSTAAAANPPLSTITLPSHPDSEAPAGAEPAAETRPPTAKPPLASLLPPGVRFSYKKGGPLPAPATLRIKRPQLKVSVPGPERSWLSAISSSGGVSIVTLSTAAGLSPGIHRGVILFNASPETARLDVVLDVTAGEGEPPAVTTQPPAQPSPVQVSPAQINPGRANHNQAVIPDSAAETANASSAATPKPYYGPKRRTRQLERIPRRRSEPGARRIRRSVRWRQAQWRYSAHRHHRHCHAARARNSCAAAHQHPAHHYRQHHGQRA